MSNLKSIFNRAITRTGIDITSPFANYELPKMNDATPRIAFTLEEVLTITADLRNESPMSVVACIIAVQAHTGMATSELVGCRIEDAKVRGENIPYLDLTPNPIRPLKNESARPRKVPLVGLALDAVERLLEIAGEIGSTEYLCPQYIKNGELKATHAANAINKRLKGYGYGKTGHGFRHFMVSSLKSETDTPLDVRYSITGHSLGTEAERSYDRGDIQLHIKQDALLALFGGSV